MESSVLRKLQQVEIEILDEVVRVCNKYNINYFLVGGTLLGAVRHKGFIPWDDDIDIAMLRSDYDLFLNVASKELDEKYKIQHWSNDKKYYLNFIKVRKKNTLLEEKKMQNVDTQKEIFIDIFPLDNIASNSLEYYKKRSRLFNVLRPIILCKTKIISKEELPSKLFYYLFSLIPNHLLLKIQDKVMRKDNKKDTKYLVSFPGSYYEKEIISKEVLFPLKKVEFEGKKYNCPNDVDSYLKDVYGDYMTLPPKDKRVAHLPQKILFDVEKGV